MREEIAKWYFGYSSWDAVDPRLKAFCYKRADELLPIIRKEIEKGGLIEEEILQAFVGIPRAKLQMTWFKGVAQAQLQRILGFFGDGE